MEQPKRKGGRPKGSPNRLTLKARRRLMRGLEPGLRNLVKYLGDDTHWQGADAGDTAKMMLTALTWIVPKPKSDEIEPLPAAAVATQELQLAITPESVLAAFRLLQRRQGPVTKPVPAAIAPIDEHTLPEAEAVQLRNSGIPIDGGRLIPAEPKPAAMNLPREAFNADGISYSNPHRAPPDGRERPDPPKMRVQTGEWPFWK